MGEVHDVASDGIAALCHHSGRHHAGLVHEGDGEVGGIGEDHAGVFRLAGDALFQQGAAQLATA